jgi:hypothetical protein
MHISAASGTTLLMWWDSLAEATGSSNCAHCIWSSEYHDVAEPEVHSRAHSWCEEPYKVPPADFTAHRSDVPHVAAYMQAWRVPCSPRRELNARLETLKATMGITRLVRKTRPDSSGIILTQIPVEEPG